MAEEITGAAPTNTSTGAAAEAPVAETPASDTAVPAQGAAPAPEQKTDEAPAAKYAFGLDGDDDEGAAESGSTGEKAGEEKHEGAPEKYDFGELDKNAPEIMGAFSGAAKDLNLSQEQADSLVAKMQPALVKSNEAYLARCAKQWEEQAVSDAEYGGDKLAESLPVAKRAYKQFASEKLREEFRESGLDKHPEVIRLFLHVGQAVSGDVAIQGQAAKGPGYADARTMYPNSKLNP